MTPITPIGTRRLAMRRPLGKACGVEHLAHRVRQRGDGQHVVGDGLQAVDGQQQAVQQRFAQAGLLAGVDVVVVGAQDGRLLLHQRLGDGFQRLVLDGRVERCQLAAGLAGSLSLVLEFCKHNDLLP